jgi:hypothetical protein
LSNGSNRLQQENEPLFGKARLQFEIRNPLSPESAIVAEDESIYSVKRKRRPTLKPA